MNEAKDTLEKAKTPFRNAIEKLRRAQRRVDNVCRIRTCNSLCVPGFKIKWCKVGWFEYPCFRRTNCMFQVPNVPCHIVNAGCRVIRGVAYVALEAAKLFVRVPMLAVDAAKVVVSLAQIVVDKSKGLLILANGALEIAKFGLDTANGVLEVAKYGLDAVKFVVGAALHVFDLIVQYGFKSLLDVRNCGFELQLSTSDKSFFDVSCELKAFLLGLHKFKFKFDFKHPVLSMMKIAKSTVDTLFEIIKDVIGKRKRRDLSFQAMTTLHHVVQLYKRDTLKANESFYFQNFAEENGTFIEDAEIYMRAKYINRTEYFAFNCDSFLKVYRFFTEAVDTLHTMSNESALNINIIEEYKLTLQENATFFNFTPEAIGINTEYALKDFNMTSDDIQSALLNFSISPEAFMIAQMTNVSEDTVNILDSQLNEVQTISLMNHWILAMANTTKDYFDESECSGFKDCVMLGFSMLHDLFIDDLIPSIDISRNTTSHLEDIFMELLSNDSWSIVESNDRSSAIARELRKLNESNMWCSVAPSARAGTTSNNGLYGASLYLWCLSSGSPIPEIRWYLNNTLINDANGTELRIRYLDHNNVGLYRCEAQNIVANVTSEDVEVTVTECHAGTFYELGQCKHCAKGYFQIEENKLECVQCNHGYTTKSIGASSVADCTDLDECSEDLHLCEHHCQNKNGSFTCSCNDGYQLISDKKSCLPVESSISVKVTAGAVSGTVIVVIIAIVIYKCKVKKKSKISSYPTTIKTNAAKTTEDNRKR